MSWLFGPASNSKGKPSPNGAQFPSSTGVSTSNIRNVDGDTDLMFKEHTVEEMKELEKKTRLDIDRRREDLRQMVG